MNPLSVQNLGKAYRTYSSEWKRFASWFGIITKPAAEHWVLRHINFEIKSGEAIGIIGQNGAGKSTLLKIITGTLQPTEGKIQISGRISAILELGMGFHPDLTGRQNAYHGMGLMGLSHNEICQAMPEVETFSEITEYFDQPVRTYSSGMQIRVAFAIATAFRPDILIIDEALSVGDAAFQRKCFRHIESYMNEGMSLLLVSHDIESIKKICSKAVYIKKGSQLGFGDAKEICNLYEKDLFGINKNLSKPDSIETITNSNSLLDPTLLPVNELSYGNGQAVIQEVWFENNSGDRVNIINTGVQFSLNYRVRFESLVRYPTFSFLIKTMEGISLYGTDTLSLEEDTGVYNHGDSVLISFKLKNNLSAGTYFVNCGIRDESGENAIFIHRRVDVAMFKVHQKVDMGQVGLVNLATSFSIQKD